MGIEPFLISSSVIGIIAQRLVRRICPQCKKVLEVTPEIQEIMNDYEIRSSEITLYQGEGCSNCKHTGYKGRIALFELMIITDTIRELITKNVNNKKLKEVALEEGMCTLKEDGIKKVCAGITTISEVLRVVTS